MERSIIMERAIIFELVADGWYTAYVPSLPGCEAEGRTLEEAKKNIKWAIMSYVGS